MDLAPQPAPTAPRATVSLVLGILGIIVCPICAPFAWAIGRGAESEIDTSRGALGGRGLATAGKITGIIGTVFLILYILAFVVFFAFLGYALNEGVENGLQDVPR